MDILIVVVLIVVLAVAAATVAGVVVVVSRRRAGQVSTPPPATSPPKVRPADVPMTGLESALSAVTDREGRPIRDRIAAESGHVDEFRVPDDTGPLLRRALDHVVHEPSRPPDPQRWPDPEVLAPETAGDEPDQGPSA